MRKYISTALIILISSFSFAQEFNCQVVIDSEQLQTQEKQLLNDLKNVIQEFINNRRWTQDDFEPHERITCTFVIQLLNDGTNVNAGVYKATGQIVSSRPVYGSDYESTVFSFIDKNFGFRFGLSQAIQFNENGFNDNLTSMIAFYAYIMLGMDYDTFSEKGGSEFFEKARNIVNVQSSDREFEGWSMNDGIHTRYWLIEHLTSPQFEDYRKGLYQYHREGFDILTKKPQDAQKKVLQVINNISKIREIVPMSTLLQSFFMAKSDELVNLFKGADNSIKMQAVTVLSKVDPTNTSKYDKIMGR